MDDFLKYYAVEHDSLSIDRKTGSVRKHTCVLYPFMTESLLPDKNIK